MLSAEILVDSIVFVLRLVQNFGDIFFLQACIQCKHTII